jgi:hypothetical protein
VRACSLRAPVFSSFGVAMSCADLCSGLLHGTTSTSAQLQSPLWACCDIQPPRPPGKYPATATITPRPRGTGPGVVEGGL